MKSVLNGEIEYKIKHTWLQFNRLELEELALNIARGEALFIHFHQIIIVQPKTVFKMIEYEFQESLAFDFNCLI